MYSSSSPFTKKRAENEKKPRRKEHFGFRINSQRVKCQRHACQAERTTQTHAFGRSTTHPPCVLNPTKCLLFFTYSVFFCFLPSPLIFRRAHFSVLSWFGWVCFFLAVLFLPTPSTATPPPRQSPLTLRRGRWLRRRCRRGSGKSAGEHVREGHLAS